MTDLDTCKRAAVYLQEHYPLVEDSTHSDILSQLQPKGCYAGYKDWGHFILFNKHPDGCTCPNALRICVQDNNENSTMKLWKISTKARLRIFSQYILIRI